MSCGNRERSVPKVTSGRFCTERLSNSVVKQPWHGVNPGTLMDSCRYTSGLCTVLHVMRPSERTVRIAERGKGTVPAPKYWTLALRREGVELTADVPWWDVEGEVLC